MPFECLIDLNAFVAWSGAVPTLARIREEGKIEELEDILKELYPDGMEEGVLNDLLRFYPEIVFDWLEMKTDEELEAEEEEAAGRSQQSGDI